MLDLTVVSVESLLNTVHTCSSRRASGNCNIYKPKGKKKNNSNNNYSNFSDSEKSRKEKKKKLRESFLVENIFFSFRPGLKESEYQMFLHFEAQFPF